MDKHSKDRLCQYLRTEITLRKSTWPQLITDGKMDRDTANLRYTCLQTALSILEGGIQQPKVIQPLASVLGEMMIWKRSISRNATPQTMRLDGLRIREIELFISKYSEAKPSALEQLKLL